MPDLSLEWCKVIRSDIRGKLKGNEARHCALSDKSRSTASFTTRHQSPYQHDGLTQAIRPLGIAICVYLDGNDSCTVQQVFAANTDLPARNGTILSFFRLVSIYHIIIGYSEDARTRRYLCYNCKGTLQL